MIFSATVVAAFALTAMALPSGQVAAPKREGTKLDGRDMLPESLRGLVKRGPEMTLENIAENLARRGMSVNPDSKEFKRQDAASSGCPDPLNTPSFTDTFTCPHTWGMDSNGDCTAGLTQSGDTTSCACYCEVRNSWFPGPESPFLNSACAAGDSCTLSAGNVSIIPVVVVFSYLCTNNYHSLPL
jgi:hypothetical protein